MYKLCLLELSMSAEIPIATLIYFEIFTACLYSKCFRSLKFWVQLPVGLRWDTDLSLIARLEINWLGRRSVKAKRGTCHLLSRVHEYTWRCLDQLLVVVFLTPSHTLFWKRLCRQFVAHLIHVWPLKLFYITNYGGLFTKTSAYARNCVRTCSILHVSNHFTNNGL